MTLVHSQIYGRNLILFQFIKKEIKQLLQNYRPPSLLPFSWKNSWDKCCSIQLQENDLLCENQSSFQSYDTCEYQLLSIVHKIYGSFDCNPPFDVRAAFLDISKAFNRVWHKGLICKIKCLGITGLPMQLIQGFLKICVFLDIHQWPYERHFINCQIICWWYIYLFCCQ